MASETSRTEVWRTSESIPCSSNLTAQVQEEFLYLFERINEPLYLGTRGHGKYYYDVPTNHLDPLLQDACRIIKSEVSQSHLIPVQRPEPMPDLTEFASICSRHEHFYTFIPAHQQAVAKLTKLLLGVSSINEFRDLSIAVRDSPLMNTTLWLNAMATAIMERKDLQGLRIPSLWEIMPTVFLNEGAKRLALEQAVRPPATRAVIVMNDPASDGDVGRVEIGPGFTGTPKNMEQRLWYYREDIGVANHHWHWHIIYARDLPKEARDRKGELFYYMHHDMVARYDANRLANGLNRVKPLDISIGPVIPAGYFSKLTAQNSSRPFGARQDWTKMRSIDRPDQPINVSIEDFRKWKDRLYDALETHVAIDADGNRVKLTEPEGIDILGGLVENGGENYSINPRFYGNIHNLGHVAIAAAHDPEYLHKEPLGVMAETSTSVRDPVFYRWHKFIDDIFHSYKETLPRYKPEELLWDQVKITGVEVRTRGSKRPNFLMSNWAQNDIDVTRGLDFTRPKEEGPVWVRLTRLDNQPFTYNIDVTLSGSTPALGTVRIFMAPRFNDYGKRFPFQDQRRAFFEMDKFSFMFQPGANNLTRSSLSSSVTIPIEQSFADIEAGLTDPHSPASAVCGCGWPQNLLFPKGTPDGMTYDLFVMVTDGSKDVVTTDALRNSRGCVDALSYCGSLGQKYPDKKPMGFPFDKRPPKVKKPTGEEAQPSTLEQFVKPNANMKTVQVKIVHRNTTTIRPGGAPPNAFTLRVPPDDRSEGSSSYENGEFDEDEQVISKRDFSPDRFSD